MSAPEQCIVCSVAGNSVRWNDLDIFECPVCGLAWRATFDLPATYYAELHATDEGIERGKLDARLRNSRSRYATVQRFLPAQGICDVGCGEGSFMSVLREMGHEACWGIEPSRFACNAAREEGFDVEEGVIENLAHIKKNRPLMAATAFHVIEHVTDPRSMLHTLHDALPSGGTLVLETPDAWAPLQRITGHANALIYPEHLFYFTPTSLVRLLREAGFTVRVLTHRSFDWNNASIRASLTRLGMRFSESSPTPYSGSGTSKRVQSTVNSQGGFLRSIIRSALAHLVHLFERDDYLLVVAQRI